MKKIYKIKGMDCSSCASLIEMDLEDAGIKASCSYPKETLEVEFEADKVMEDKVREVVKNSGYVLS